MDPPSSSENNTRTTDSTGVAFFAKTIQYCYGIAEELCAWTVTYNGAAVVFSGPTVSCVCMPALGGRLGWLLFALCTLSVGCAQSHSSNASCSCSCSCS